MTPFPRDTMATQDALTEHLKSVLPGAKTEKLAVDDAQQPLLLLSTQYLRTAFGFAGSDLMASYESLIGAFKRKYRESKGEWDRFDLAFVLCINPELKGIERLWSQIETDVFFCRKFVLRLSSHVPPSVSRLPFLPLTPLHDVSLRPPSALALLHQYGMPTDLARYLVAPHTRSAGRIVQDCLIGQFGEPHSLGPTPELQPQIVGETASPIQLKSVAIRNFRAYRETQEFDIGSAVTVLYGPNGFGKTSFFDAIDFAVTGGIGRFEPADDARFLRLTQHLDASGEDGAVDLQVVQGDHTLKLSRKLAERKNALLDNNMADRKAVLSAVTGLQSSSRIEHMVSLFRATHLFSQEQQELMREFQNDCRLPAEIVSRMLAFDDYTNALSKSLGVQEVINSELVSKSNALEALEDLIAQDKNNIAKLQRSAEAAGNVATLDDELAQLQGRLQEQGIAKPDEKPDATVLRGWRAALESRIAQTQSYRDRLSSLSHELAENKDTHAELKRVDEHLKDGGHRRSTLDANARQRATERDECAKQLSNEQSQLASALQLAEAWDWCQEKRSDYARFLQDRKLLTDTIGRAQAELYNARQEVARAQIDQQRVQGEVTQMGERVTKQEGALSQLGRIATDLLRLQANLDRQKRLETLVQTLITTRDLAATKADQLHHLLAKAQSEEQILARTVAQTEQNQSEFKSLLLALQSHIVDGICPLCGEEHESKDHLLSRISQRLQSDEASSAREELLVVAEAVKRMHAQITGIKDEQRMTEERLETVRSDLMEVKTDTNAILASARSVGIVVDGEAQSAIAQLHHQIAVDEATLLGLRESSETAKMKSAQSAAACESAANVVVALERTLRDYDARMILLRDEIKLLTDDARFSRAPLDSGDAVLVEQGRQAHSDVSNHRTAVKNLQARLSVVDGSIRQCVDERKTMDQELATLRLQHATLREKWSRLVGRLADLNLTEPVTEESILEIVRARTRTQAELESLRDTTRDLEMAVDAAMTAAALGNVRDTIRTRQTEVERLRKEKTKIEPWLQHFGSIHQVLSQQQHKAIARFTQEYGPRASVIQQRLRAVYGFDDIDIESVQGTIKVQVNRNNKKYRPTDYFSQSQQQTLLLGLFLTACISQNWSSLAPVFLDDPVTHFDDLNTYAFLDLLLGLLQDEREKRQFIISTCDAKLFQLARQKFRHFGDRAIFYRFSAIGSEGPTVERI